MGDNRNPKITIDRLPEEILMNIFEKLNGKDLKNVFLVCKRWNNLAAESNVIMRNLPLSIDCTSWAEIFRDTQNLITRKHHTLKISESCDWNRSTEKVFRQIGSDLRYVIFNSCEFPFSKSKRVTELLNIPKKLEKLVFIDSDPDFDNDGLNSISIKPKDLKNLKNLKSVVLHDSSFALLEFFKLTQLKSLKIHARDVIDMEKYFFDFLATQNHLEELALRAFIPDQSVPVDKISAISFPLKRLSLVDVHNLFDTEENLLAFLKRFTSSLEELEISGHFPDAVFKMIFKEFKKLKVLNVRIRDAPTEKNFYQDLSSNTSVRKLIVRNFKEYSSASLEGFIGNLPCVETLVIDSDDISNQNMLFISNNLQSLKHIKFRSVNGPMFKDVQMQNVVSLSTVNLYTTDINYWKATVKALPNIESFAFENIFNQYSMFDRVFNILTKGWKRLSHLKLGNGFNGSKRKFNQILRNCQMIKTVEVYQDAFDDQKSSKTEILRSFKKDGLQFIIHPKSPDGSTNKFKKSLSSLWSTEQDVNIYESDSDDDDDDFDSDDSSIDDLNMVFGALVHVMQDSSDYEAGNEYIYFDSDGEMRRWDEDPEDYGIFF